MFKEGYMIVRMSSSIVSNHGSKSMMGATVNMAITIFGFVLSALFIVVICCRLLCSRFRHRGPQSSSLDNALDRRRPTMSSIERSLQGLEPSIISRFPTIKYNRQLFTSTNDNVCTICLADYKERELLRVLPKCAHTFHVACIDTWLRQHYTCPICRISLRIICEWRSTSGPFISLLAKPRFVQGALPEYLFEQTSIDKVEMGESSSRQGFDDSLEVGDCNMISANVQQPSNI